MKWSSRYAGAGACDLDHGGAVTAATGEMWSVAVFSLTHKFCWVLVQLFYCSGEVSLCIWPRTHIPPAIFEKSRASNPDFVGCKQHVPYVPGPDVLKQVL